MKKERSILFAPLPDALYRLPAGPKWVAAFYLLAWLGIHFVFIHTLITGRVSMRRTGGAGFDLHASSPTLFWLYVSIIGIVLFMFDVFVFRAIWLARTKEPIQPDRGSS